MNCRLSLRGSHKSHNLPEYELSEPLKTFHIPACASVQSFQQNVRNKSIFKIRMWSSHSLLAHVHMCSVHTRGHIQWCASEQTLFPSCTCRHVSETCAFSLRHMLACVFLLLHPALELLYTSSHFVSLLATILVKPRDPLVWRFLPLGGILWKRTGRIRRKLLQDRARDTIKDSVPWIETV